MSLESPEIKNTIPKPEQPPVPGKVEKEGGLKEKITVEMVRFHDGAKDIYERLKKLTPEQLKKLDPRNYNLTIDKTVLLVGAGITAMGLASGIGGLEGVKEIIENPELFHWLSESGSNPPVAFALFLTGLGTFLTAAGAGILKETHPVEITRKKERVKRMTGEVNWPGRDD